MRSELILRKNFIGGDTIQHTIGKGHVNGLLLVSSNRVLVNTSLTVKRRTESGKTHVLAAGVTFRELSRISDQEYGYSFMTGRIVTSLAELLVTETATTGITQAMLNTWASSGTGGSVFMAYVDLGSVFLGHQSELDVTINVDPALVAGNFGLYRVSRRRAPDFMFQYDSSVDFEATHRNVDAIFLSNKTLTGADAGLIVDPLTSLISSEPPLSIQVDDGSEQYLTDYMGVMASTAVFSQVEMIEQAVVCIYRRPDVLPANVFVKVQGIPSNNWRLLVRKVIYDELATSQNTVSEAENLAGRIAELEVRDSATAKALRHAGEIVKSEVLAAAAAAQK